MMWSRSITRSFTPACAAMYVDFPEQGGPQTIVRGIEEGFSQSGCHAAPAEEAFSKAVLYAWQSTHSDWQFTSMS